MIESLHHIQIAMPEGEEAAARAFYGGVLGFEEVAKPDALQGRGGVWFERREIRLHLGIDRPFRPAAKAHPGFRVTSLSKMISHLERAGVTYRSDIDLPEMRRVYVSDPFGNRIELLETAVG